MWDEILKGVSVYFTAMIKFIFGPLGGYAAGFNIFVTILLTVTSMMTVVLVLSVFGEFIRTRIFRKLLNPKKFTDRNRRYVWIWRKYGILGISILTPVLLSPIGGTLLAISFGTPKSKLIIYMFVSASFWAVAFSLVVYLLGNEIFPDFMK